MSFITLIPISTINASESYVEGIKRLVRNSIAKFGSNLTRERLTRSLNDRGSVVSIDSDLAAVVAVIFDQHSGDMLMPSGVRKRDEIEATGRDRPRAYSVDEDIQEGDFLLINYDAGVYDERYRVVEKEIHVLADCEIFYTLYLDKEAN